MGALRVHALVIAVSLLLVAPVVQAVEVEKGVQFHIDGGNASVDFAQNESFDSITVREDSILFGSWYVSIDHLGDKVLNATIWNHSLRNLLGTPTLRVETDNAGGEADFEVGDAQAGHDYRIARDSTTIDTVSVGSDSRLAWRATELDISHNYTATLLAEFLNVTLRLKGDFDHPNDEVYIDGQQRGEGGYTDEDLDFGYVSFEQGGKVAGVVPAGAFLRLEYDLLSDTQEIEQTQAGDNNIFLVPFTEGSHNTIENRESLIQGDLFGSGNFLGFPSPNFAYALTRDKTVRVILSYDSIPLQGFNDTIRQGSYSLIIQNRGNKTADKARITQQ